MKISDLAARGGCDVQTVRYYEREGLLEPPARTSSGYRVFEDADVRRLQFIRHCRTLDIPLAEIRELIGLSASPGASCGQVNGLLDSHIQRVEMRLSSLRVLRRQLTQLRAQCVRPEADACAILDAFSHAVEEQVCACHPSTS